MMAQLLEQVGSFFYFLYLLKEILIFSSTDWNQFTIDSNSECSIAKVSSNANGIFKRIIAKNNVILSSEVFGTSYILLHSSIRNRKELKAVGIMTIVNNPSVGKNITDYILVKLCH